MVDAATQHRNIFYEDLVDMNSRSEGVEIQNGLTVTPAMHRTPTLRVKNLALVHVDQSTLDGAEGTAGNRPLVYGHYNALVGAGLLSRLFRFTELAVLGLPSIQFHTPATENSTYRARFRVVDIPTTHYANKPHAGVVTLEIKLSTTPSRDTVAYAKSRVSLMGEDEKKKFKFLVEAAKGADAGNNVTLDCATIQRTVQVLRRDHLK